VAIPWLVEPHVTEFVRFCVLWSEYVPVAVNCSVEPITIVGFMGVTPMDTSVGDTVKIVEPFTPLRLALIVVDPDATLVAKPFDPAVLLIVATF
jgi:hypothetical protein